MWFTEMVSYARPRIPSNLPKAKASPGSLVASAKSWCLMARSPMTTVSCETKPSSEPEPYRMANSVPLALYVDEADESYLACSWCVSVVSHVNYVSS